MCSKKEHATKPKSAQCGCPYQTKAHLKATEAGQQCKLLESVLPVLENVLDLQALACQHVNVNCNCFVDDLLERIKQVPFMAPEHLKLHKEQPFPNSDSPGLQNANHGKLDTSAASSCIY
jgi:hypothetical protein